MSLLDIANGIGSAEERSSNTDNSGDIVKDWGEKVNSKYADLYEGLPLNVLDKDGTLSYDDVEKYIATHTNAMYESFKSRLLHGMKIYIGSCYQRDIYLYCIDKLLKIGNEKIRESFIYASKFLKLSIDEEVKYVNEVKDRAATLVAYCMNADKYMEWAAYNTGHATLSELYRRKIYTIKDLRMLATDAGMRELYRKIAYEFREIESPNDLILNNTFMGVGKIIYAGKEKRNFDRIYVDITCRSDATASEVKQNINIAKDMLMFKLKNEKTFKDNPELLKHLKISDINFSKAVLSFIIEWKESFAYDE